MRLTPPCPSIDFSTNDVFGNSVKLSDYKGKKLMLAFFRDAACPFCNYRVYELTQQYKGWKDKNFEIIAIFSSPDEEVRRYIARHPRPFRIVSDTELNLYNQYGIEHSSSALIKALIFKLPRIIMGMIKGGYPQPNPNVKVVPADFLINEEGKIEHVWYGRDTSDHMPMDQLNKFIES
jgi:peroxiredoxin Q/BCP